MRDPKMRNRRNIQFHELLVLVPIRRPANVNVLDVNFVLLASNEVVDTGLLRSAEPKERLATSLTRPVIDEEVAIDVELHT